jgi:hypothetical protein
LLEIIGTTNSASIPSNQIPPPMTQAPMTLRLDTVSETAQFAWTFVCWLSCDDIFLILRLRCGQLPMSLMLYCRRYEAHMVCILARTREKIIVLITDP